MKATHQISYTTVYRVRCELNSIRRTAEGKNYGIYVMDVKYHTTNTNAHAAAAHITIKLQRILTIE